MDWSLHSAHTSTPSSTCECAFAGCEITQEGFEVSDVCSADTGLTQSGLSGRGISSNWHHRIKHLQRAAELIWARDTCKLATPVGKTNRRFIARMISSSLRDLSEVYPVPLRSRARSSRATEQRLARGERAREWVYSYRSAAMGSTLVAHRARTFQFSRSATKGSRRLARYAGR